MKPVALDLVTSVLTYGNYCKHKTKYLWQLEVTCTKIIKLQAKFSPANHYTSVKLKLQ